MKIFLFERQQFIPKPLNEVFDFFSETRNLGAITPPWLQFEVLTPVPIEMRRGALIDYRLKWHGLPIRWRTEIMAWEPQRRFVDRQLRGPYRQWVHEHLFAAKGKGTSVIDRVEYAVYGGSLVQRFMVGPDVERIFDYREREILCALEKRSAE